MKTIPWQALGADVQGAMTAAEAIQSAGLDWTVEKRPVQYASGRGLLTMEDRYVTARTDNDGGLGIVGDQYRPLQNKEAFSYFDAIVGEKGAHYTRAGSLDGGSRVWIMAKLPQSVKVAGVDAVDSYLILHNTHDGSSSVRMDLMALRLVCSNGLRRMVSEGGFAVRHSAAMGQKLQAARTALRLSVESMDQFLEAADAMARKKLNAGIVEDFLNGIGLAREQDESTRRENIRMDVLRLIESGAGHQQEPIRNSLWTAVNAVTEYVDHKGGDADKRLNSIWFGSGARLKEQAFETALTLAK
jgi:phage/plasmid-like protein (TIGR03299 family)